MLCTWNYFRICAVLLGLCVSDCSASLFCILMASCRCHRASRQASYRLATMWLRPPAAYGGIWCAGTESGCTPRGDERSPRTTSTPRQRGAGLRTAAYANRRSRACRASAGSLPPPHLRRSGTLPIRNPLQFFCNAFRDMRSSVVVMEDNVVPIH